MTKTTLLIAVLAVAATLAVIMLVIWVAGTVSAGVGKGVDSIKTRHTKKLHSAPEAQALAKRPAEPSMRTPPAGKRSSTTEPKKGQATAPRKPVVVGRQRPPKQTGFATRRPTDSFVLVCECPHCGTLDTHDLRAPARPAPTECPSEAPKHPEQQEKSWWAPMVGWFTDADNDASERPGNTATARESETSKTSAASWWDVSSWFTKSEPYEAQTDAADTEPTTDHPDAGVVRTCRSCEHVWAQLEPGAV